MPCGRSPNGRIQLTDVQAALATYEAYFVTSFFVCDWTGPLVLGRLPAGHGRARPEAPASGGRS